MPCSMTPGSHPYLPCRVRVVLPSGIITPSASHFHILFGAQSHASAYGLQSSLSTLNSSRYLLASKTKYGWVVPFPDCHFRQLLIKRLVAHNDMNDKNLLMPSALFSSFLSLNHFYHFVFVGSEDFAGVLPFPQRLRKNS